MSGHIFEMPMVLSMAPLYSLGPSDQIKVKIDFFSQVLPLLPAFLSCDGNCIINGTILFIRWRQLKKRCDRTPLVMWCCWHQCQKHMTLIALSMSQFCLLGRDDWNKVLHDTDGLINSTTALVRSRWSKWDMIWVFSVIWHCWHWL